MLNNVSYDIIVKKQLTDLYYEEIILRDAHS